MLYCKFCFRNPKKFGRGLDNPPPKRYNIEKCRKRRGEKMSEHEKIFPDCFPEDFEEKYLPHNLPNLKISVFRVCTNGTINKETFLSTFEEICRGLKPAPKRWKKNAGKFDPGYFSVSCNDTRKAAEDVLKCLVGSHPKAFLIYGTASSELGPLQRTSDREPSRLDKSHFDWWLYADSDPSADFKRVEGNR